MSFRDNSNLYPAYHAANVTNVIGGSGNNYDGSVGSADAFVVTNGSGATDTITNFGKNDSLISHNKIYDGNNDGYIDFGPNGVLDVDRTSSRKPGHLQIAVTGEDGNRVDQIRYLGTKGDGNYVYADSSVRLNVYAYGASHGQSGASFESTVGNDTLTGSKGGKGGADLFLFDTALGLNLGSDTIKNFSDTDLLVTTTALYDSNNDNVITFGRNHVLDLAAGDSPTPQDPAHGPGGQIAFSSDIQSLFVLGEKSIGGVEYYFYGHSTAAGAGLGLDPIGGA